MAQTMGLDYALLSFENKEEGFTLSQNECLNAEKGTKEEINKSVLLKDNTVYLRVQVKPDNICIFSYSTDNKKYKNIGRAFKAKEGKWIGAKIGTFCTRPVHMNDGGRTDIGRFEVSGM
ncbi:hypothetical protein FACS1894179_00350 [Bacteroidia bacterium]|nr:hypothetical protein FACS1894179_00350 [Bacteroidia bacterium]